VNEPASAEPAPAEQPAAEPAPQGFIVAWSVLVLFVYLVVGGTAQFLHLSFGLWFSEVVLFLALALVGWHALQLSPRLAMGVTRFEPRSFGLGVAFGLVNYAAWAVPTMTLAHAVFPKHLIELFDSAKVFERQTPFEFWAIVVGVSVAAPLGEEFFFRGFLQRGLEASRGAPRAIVVTAFIFSAFHLDPVGLVSRFELGVLFGLLAWRAGSIWPAIGAHAANNALSSALFLATRDAPQADEELPWLAALSMFVVGNLVLLALVRFSSGKLQISQPSALEMAPRRVPLLRAFAPWALGGLASVAILLAADWRGVALNVIDGVAQPSAALKKREDLTTLRARARRGEVPLEDYRAAISPPP
jgi:hypothetical protein